jgi:hypothetical protein
MDDNLAAFLTVTGCQDEASAKFYLESANNDVEQAINMYMEQGGAAPDTGTKSAQDSGDQTPEANFSVGMADATPGGEEQRFRASSKCRTRVNKRTQCNNAYFCGYSGYHVALIRCLLS